MSASKILYEPLPIGRVGVRKDTQEVVIAKDFSAFAQMIEEYISFGAVNIVIPSSSPEVEVLEQMPKLLKDRISIIEDSEEIEIVNRILFEIRNEFDAKLNSDSTFIKLPKNTPRELIHSLDQIHSDVKNLSLGFNHGIQIGFHIESSINAIRYLRGKVYNRTSRVVLAQLEGLLQQYESVEFQAVTPPKEDTPFELINIFDKLINDESYLEYSNAITELTLSDRRENTLRNIRELSQKIGSKNYVSVGWDYLTKIIKVLSGVPLPESKAISSIIKGQKLPQLVNLSNAKANALDIWRKTSDKSNPLRRNGQPIGDKNVTWLPPLDSMEIRSEDNRTFSLGKVGELLKVLEDFQEKTKNKNEAQQ